MVDPWMGETACESCFGQLDGPSPLDDPLPDLAIGRLPVTSATELQAVVAKLVAYETAPVDGAWQSRTVYVADNYRDAAGNVDSAGDFAAFAENVIAPQPPQMQVTRVFYDPSSTGSLPGHEPDAVQAHARTMDALQAGAGLVTYVGHAHRSQWAVTDPTASPSWLLGLYDVDLLHNGARLPIVLEMTCLTSAFFQPSFSGTTIDERLLLQPQGGAAGVWGPTGLGLGYGHDRLIRGVSRALWRTSAQPATLGELTQAGYLELYSHGECCQETLRTYALLGDPLTIPHIYAPRSIYLPYLRR
jgi:hypothetical protein